MGGGGVGGSGVGGDVGGAGDGVDGGEDRVEEETKVRKKQR